MSHILFVSSEVHPLVKTGGLADVSGSLPRALAALDQEVRIFMPAYREAKRAANDFAHLTNIHLEQGIVSLLETTLPDSIVKVWMLDFEPFFDRPGTPYLDEEGKPWPDNGERFALFCRVAVEIAMNRLGLGWKADLVHCNDWQSGLVPALLTFEENRPATLFTIHNLAYQGLFPFSTFTALELPAPLWGHDALEFHNQMCFIKGGLVYADRISTVSPNYALEIQTPEFGCGLEGLLKHRKSRLRGILNGIDSDQWNPAGDPFIAECYDEKKLRKKAKNKAALKQEIGLPPQEVPLIASIGRLVQQKGIDLVLEAMPKILELSIQFVLLGSGESHYEQKLLHWARRFPDKFSVAIGYDEALSHRIEAGADLFLMPSRFEPCGLNQMYSQRYGTIPIVRQIGGLADTVVDAVPSTLAEGSATGIVFAEATSGALLEAVKRALILHANEALWRKMQRAGMGRDFSWEHSAGQYIELYRQAIDDSKAI